MKHLHDDELLMSALDGIDDLDLSQLDAKQAKEFQALSLLKSDLKLLNDIPECQLSNERLRRRILEEGMQPQAQPRGWFWFASAGAISCACMAVAAVMVWNWYQPAAPAASQTLALSTDSSPTLESMRTDPLWEKVKFESPAKETSQPVTPPVKQPEPRRENGRSSSRPNRIRTNRTVLTMASAASEGVGYLTKQAVTQTTPPPGPAQISSDAMPEMDSASIAPMASQPSAAAKSSVPGNRPASVVVISQSSTPEPTVESAGHVVFGG